MSEACSQVKLGDVCEFVRGPFGGSLKKESFVEKGFAVYEQQHAIYDQFEDIRYFIDGLKFNDMSRFVLSPGDLIMSCSGTMGKVAIVPEGIKDGVINQALLKMTPSSSVDIKYLKYWVESDSFQNILSANTHGAAIKNVASVKVLKDLKIPLPPLKQQKRIAAILDKSVKLRRKRQQAIQLADEFLRAVFLDMFGDPVSNPKGWEVVDLSALVDPSDRLNYGVVQPGDEVPDGIPLVRSGDLSDLTPKVSTLRKVSDSVDNRHRKSRLKGNEILIACVGSIGKVGLVTNKMVGWNIARAVTRIPLMEGVNREYIYRYLQSPVVQGYFERETRAVAQPTLNVGLIAKTPIALPPVDLQQKFLCKFSKIASFKDKLVRSLTLEDGLFTSLSQKAFSGNL